MDLSREEFDEVSQQAFLRDLAARLGVSVGTISILELREGSLVAVLCFADDKALARFVNQHANEDIELLAFYRQWNVLEVQFEPTDRPKKRPSNDALLQPGDNAGTEKANEPPTGAPPATGSSKGRIIRVRAKVVYISYAWGDDRETGPSREDIVDRLFESLAADGYDVRRDKMDLGYKGLISQFMTEIGRGVCVVVVISDKYLRSPYCMWELLQIYRNLQFRERICPIVLADAQIHSVDGRIEYTEFWHKERKRVDTRVKKLGIEALSTEGTLREAEKIREISHTVDKLLTFVADMNTLNPDLLAANNFETLKRAIDERLGQIG